ncbi:nucleolar and coiled-body phosphoprotein 1-like [Lucilia sericata]|uniref:nucleolar and coiled-body phosphoprotein 1-like n=1 Tax=Lucilia sericata TaxID=13632 RepID=UPI0018A83685|nr:nucleolar and coiled-body phosphoprotein 1-like [Lucilia sericata]
MATNCEYIEENLKQQQKCGISKSASLSSMTHEEKQDSTEKSPSKSSFSDTSSEVGSTSGGGGGGSGQSPSTLQKSKKLQNNGHLPIVPSIGDCVFEHAFEKSMDDLEHGGNDGYETDSETSLNGDHEEEPFKELTSSNSENLTCSTGLGSGPLRTFPKSNSFEYHSSSTDSDEDAEDGIIHAAINMSPKFCNSDIFQMRPYLMPFIERRRLSQCKEEEDEDEADKSPQPQGDQPPKYEKAIPAPPPPPPAKDKASAEKFKDLERLRQQFMHKIDSINTSNVDDIKTVTVTPEMSSPPPPPPIPPTILPPALINLLESAKSTTSAKTATTTASSIPTTPVNTSKQQPRSPSPETLIIKGKFTVTKAQETPELQQLRNEADKLKHLDSSANAHTISFPSSFGGYSSVQGLFSQRYGSNKYSPVTPHLSKKFFDSSLVEIRTPTESTSSLNKLNLDAASKTGTNCDNSINISATPPATRTTSGTLVPGKKPEYREYPHLDDVWIKRSSDSTPTSSITSATSSTLPKKQYYTTDESAAESGLTTAVQSEDEQDAKLPTSRPSSAPAEPNAKAARKASKKMKEEARRQEKEASRREKEARKIERETARRLEREAAKLEKLNRNAEKISRSTERVSGPTPRSGSLERRRSGDESPVLNQSTVHGIASPNRRPTIFDVFRQRGKSDAKKQKMLLDPLSAAAAASGNEMGSASSTHSSSGVGGGGGGAGGGGTGVMNSMKVALQNSGLIGGGHHQKQQQQHPAVTITTAEGTSVKNKYKDGSAHPHQGSDAHYYHTVTAVRRADASRSPMTKVMDLFRHRSNSAATEADKRKARAAAHQQQLAVQSE